MLGIHTLCCLLRAMTSARMGFGGRNLARGSAPARCFRMGRTWSLCGCSRSRRLRFASSRAAIALRGVDRELTAVAEGGAQRAVWTSNEEAMLLTGPAEIICRGEVF